MSLKESDILVKVLDITKSKVLGIAVEKMAALWRVLISGGYQKLDKLKYTSLEVANL